MRLHLGSLPESSDFAADDSWQRFEDKEESLWLLQLKLLPVALINMACMMLLWWVFTPVTSILRDISFPGTAVGFFLCLMGVLIVHESIHLAVHPQMGSSHRSILGLWPQKMFLYVAYDGMLSRNRFVAVLLMPFLVISIVPFVICAIANYINVWVVYSTILNAFLASLDVMAAITLLKLPNHAVVRTSGIDAYWKENR